MITKERLEELIEQGACIFYILNNSVAILRLNNSYGISTEEYNKEHNCKPQFYHSGYVYQNICDADKIFETEEDARWELELTETRTEILKMPNWEELQKAIKQVKDTSNSMYFYYSMFFYKKDYKPNSENTISFYIRDNNDIVIDDDDMCLRLFEKTLTKENYIEACKFYLRLFNGEEV